jgi:hypothetical protein
MPSPAKLLEVVQNSIDGAARDLEGVVRDFTKSIQRGRGPWRSLVRSDRRRGSSVSQSPHGASITREDELFIEKLDDENKEAYAMVLALQADSTSGWNHVVTTSGGVTVERRKMPTGSFTIQSDAAAGAKHAGVKTTGVIKASPADIFSLFINNDRVGEYNEHIVKINDVEGVVPEQYSYSQGKSKSKGKGGGSPPKEWTKLAWSSSPKYGPFQARDFLSVVNFHRRDDGSFVIINRPGYLSWYPVVKKFTRATVLLAGNVIEPHPTNPQWSRVTQIAHVNPGGVADSKIVAMTINALCAKGPPAFFAGLEKAAQK